MESTCTTTIYNDNTIRNIITTIIENIGFLISSPSLLAIWCIELLKSQSIETFGID